MSMKKILVLGLGKVGTLVAILLSDKYKVTGIDAKDPHYDYELPFDVVKGDVTSEDFLKKQLGDHDAVVSSLPYFLNKEVARLAHQASVHYLILLKM